jgi:hypothetical protein
MKAILSFVLLAGTIAWVMFGGIYNHVLMTRQTLLQQEVNYVLEIATQAKYGYISNSVMEQSKARLASKGFDPTKLEYQVSSTTGQSSVDEFHPIPRGEAIVLKIRYPYEGLLEINRLVGILPPSSNARIGSSAQRMSEYIFVQGG